MTTVLVTGVSGLARQKLFERLNGQVRHFDLGDTMRRIADERRLPYTDANILRAPAAALTVLRAAAIEQLMHGLLADHADDRPCIISTSALFLLKDRITEGLTAADLDAINPDLVITLIDGPQDIHERLKAHTGEYFHLTVEAVVRWQEFEVFFSHHLAGDRKVPHFVVPINQPETFLSLVLGENKPIVYASYPMTHLPADQRPLKDAFVQRLKESCIVFDPAAIEDALLSAPYYEASDLRAIRDHTIVRDLDWFIGINAQAVVAYWPGIVFSSGMNDELRYAYENGRETYMIVDALSAGTVPKYSPFTTYKSKMFWSADDFFDFLNEPPKLRHAFLIMQDEIVALLSQVQETGRDFTREQFRHQCKMRLHNNMPEADIKALNGELDKLADRIYERWSEVRTASKESYAAAHGSVHKKAAESEKPR
ncbi:MAG: AAA family ATPase [Mycobacterium leprae]